ncbi:MAG: TSUP family transporter [Betaproteobacteria bacterium]|nr:TSUP family transporter [Betaproteobacteria bacterium]
MELLFLAPLAFVAGLVDAVVGGGGLIQIPALFTAFPQGAPATLFGTNKLASICGTSVAALRYLRRVPVRWQAMLPALGAALVCSWLGALAVSLLPREVLRPLVLALLLLVAIYTFRRKDFGAIHAPLLGPRAERWAGLAVGAVLGFYDGFFGPGTGAFLIFLFIRYFGYDFLTASASAKLVNWTTNLAALAYFAPTGNVLWITALAMGACNIAGAVVGSQLAMRRGSGFVRGFFLVVLVALIGKFAVDTLRG